MAKVSASSSSTRSPRSPTQPEAKHEAATPRGPPRSNPSRCEGDLLELPRRNADDSAAKDSGLRTILRGVALGAPMVAGALGGVAHAAPVANVAAPIPTEPADTQLARSLLFQGPPSKVVTALERLGADGWVDGDEAEQIIPLLDAMPNKVDRASDELLRFFISQLNHQGQGGFAMGDGLRAAIEGKLRSIGYELPPREEGIPPVSMIPELIERASGRAAPSPTQLRSLFRGAGLEDRFEKHVLPQLWRIPRTASASGRELVRIYGDPSTPMSPAVAEQVGQLLRRAGYPVEVGKRPSPTEARRAIEEAIHETDPVFERILSLAGGPRSKTHIGIIDGGFEVTHRAVSSKLAVNPKEVPGNDLDDDENGFVDDVFGARTATRSGDLWTGGGMGRHGTNVLGIATKGTDRIEASLVAASGSNVVEQVDYLIHRGARVINVSLEFVRAEDAEALRAAIEANPGTLFVLSAGNDGQDLSLRKPELLAPYAPAANLVVVTATDAAGLPIPGTNHGSLVNLAARSTILSADHGGSYSTGTMTSMATPNVTNAAAKCLAIDPGLSAADLSRLLTGTATTSELWKDRVTSGGVLDAKRAMETAGLTRSLRAGASEAEAVKSSGLDSGTATELLPLARSLVKAAT
ncbi:MAG: S8 family serine peptidase [Deltaproteobacteria bacterium]|nr:S8 family serine peptidase [Deltaproteobacteria bacterium]